MEKPPKMGTWLMRRMFCCAGTLVLLQNLMLFHWTAQIRIHPPTQPAQAVQPAQATPVPIPATPVPIPATPAEPKGSAVAAPSPVGTWLGSETGSRQPPPPEPPSETLRPQASPRQLHRESSLFSVRREELRIFGNEVPEGVTMSVGFGSVKRQKDYVLDTVGIMLGLKGDCQITPQERSSVVIVAHFADFDRSWVSEISQKLMDEYKDLIAGGQFHGIHAKEEFYPTLDVCPPTCNYKDDPKRVKWRSKQNVDYAFLMYYAAPLAPYYLQIEDDINFAANWISKITGFLTSSFPPTYRSKENAPWRLIDFSQLGFIGKMFQSDELTRLAQFLLLFYDQMPCDILLGQWVLAMTQGKKIEYWKTHSSLFQHVGIFRSLGGFQTLQEKKFGKGSIFDNPNATVTRNLTIVPTYDTKFIYFPGGDPQDRKDSCDFSQSPQKQKVKRCWLWAKSPQAGQHLTLTFDRDIPMKAFLAEFGNDAHPKDLLKNAIIQVAGTESAGGASLGPCGVFHDLMPVSSSVIYWEEGVSSPPHLPIPQIRCLRILVVAAQQEWAIILQLQVRSA